MRRSRDIQARGAGKVVSKECTYQDDLEQHLLIDLHELLVPLVDLRHLLTRGIVIVAARGRVVLVVDAPLDDLCEDGVVDVGDRDGVLLGDGRVAQVLEHVLDEHGALSYGAVWRSGGVSIAAIA